MNGEAAQLKGATVLVTGATGFTGSALLRKLAEAGATVRAIARPSSDRSASSDLSVEWFVGEVFDEALVQRAMQNVQIVFHLATLYRAGDATEDEHRNVHVTSTQLLAEAALQQPDFRRFVHVSTVGVHGHIEQPPADENAPLAPGDEYQRTKLEAEQWLTTFAAQSSLSYTIIRPCGIYGPGDQRLLKVFRMANRPLTFILGKRPCLYHLIHVEDLANMLIRSATHPEAEGQVFIAGNPEPIPLDRMLSVIGDALGRRVRILRLPVAPFWILAIVCEYVCKPLGIKPPLYRRRVKFFLNDRSFDTRKLRERLSYSCIHSNEEGLRSTAQWYKANRML